MFRIEQQDKTSYIMLSPKYDRYKLVYNLPSSLRRWYGVKQ